MVVTVDGSLCPGTETAIKSLVVLDAVLTVALALVIHHGEALSVHAAVKVPQTVVVVRLG